jgi:hypothetical protein
MTEITIIYIIQIILLLLNILSALIYSIPILLIRRFHSINNAFTVNLCFATICSAIYWLSYCIAIQFYPQHLAGDQICIVLGYFGIMCTIQLPLALVEVSVYRLCSVVYFTKPFFKKKQWAMICIASQWAIGIIAPLPRISLNDSVSILN